MPPVGWRLSAGKRLGDGTTPLLGEGGQNASCHSADRNLMTQVLQSRPPPGQMEKHLARRRFRAKCLRVIDLRHFHLALWPSAVGVGGVAGMLMATRPGESALS